MELEPATAPGRQLVESYGGGRFRVSGSVYTGSVIVLPDRTLAWSVADFDGVRAETLTPVLAAPDLDLLLLGCGARMRLATASLRAPVRAAGIALEAMDTGAACRTFNVLTAEGRRVAAALIAVD
ncbi:MAG: Mth938-like domain-containing protein [Alphaproteobacteria bacterium]